MNVGEYARLKNGEIVKMVDAKVYYVLGQNAKDDYSCVTSKNNDFPSLIQNDFIVKKGKIIDLIEHMDMLYLKKPIKIYGINKTVKLFNPVRCDGFTTYDDGTHCIILNLDYIVDVNDLEIEAIVTHEQMEAIQYRVEE